MIHFKTNGNIDWDTVIDFYCVGCNEYVTSEKADFVKYLIRNQQQVFCDVCDPLPDTVHEALDFPVILVGNFAIDVEASLAGKEREKCLSILTYLHTCDK